MVKDNVLVVSISLLLGILNFVQFKFDFNINSSLQLREETQIKENLQEHKIRCTEEGINKIIKKSGFSSFKNTMAEPDLSYPT